MKDQQIYIITGLSGSGKSTVAAAFEDAKYFCVDNMPVALFPKFLELPVESAFEYDGFAFVMDLREKGFLNAYENVLNTVRSNGFHFEIIFLEADENVLVRRYSQTRRYHPLSRDRSLVEGIRAEIDQLQHLKRIADIVINTSDYNVHELKKVVFDFLRQRKELAPMSIQVMSFGFKYGIPREADLVMDVRFLVNPYFREDLRDLSGEDSKVREFVIENDVTREFMEKYFSLIDFLIPQYEKEEKAYLTIAVGCTGGRHRSVSIARSLFDHISIPTRKVELLHRDIEK